MIRLTIRKATLALGLACAVILSGVQANNAVAGNVWLSLNLELNDQADLNSGGNWTAVAKAEEHGIAGISFLAIPANNAASVSGVFNVFQTQNVGTGVEVVTGFDLVFTVLDVGVIGGSFVSTYVDPVGLIPVGSNPDFGSFTGGVALATGTFEPGPTPELLESFGTFGSGANLFLANGSAVAADLLTTVRYVGIPEPASMILLGLGLVGVTATSRRRG